MTDYWLPGVNTLGACGRWEFAELTDVYAMQADLAAKVEAELGELVEGVIARSGVAARSPGGARLTT